MDAVEEKLADGITTRRMTSVAAGIAGPQSTSPTNVQ